MDSSRTDPSQITGDDSREEGTLKPRDFFWDSAILYIVSVILALSVVDAVSEYIKGSSVVCDVRENDPASAEYINSYCTKSLPITELLPAFVFIHGLIIAIPHYLWLATFSGQFDYFFSIVSNLDRQRDEYTGRYSERSSNLVHQLEQSFTTYGRNTIYYLYICKLTLQFVFVLGSLVLAVFYFTDFKVVFSCPRDNTTVSDDPFWPLERRVTCIFTSLKLLFWVRVADIVLICLLLLSLMWGLGWSFAGHPVELGAKSVAEFSFNSGINSRFYVAPFSRFGRCNKCFATLFSWLPWRFRSPGVMTDLDFMLLKLYRTNAGLGSVFKEIQVELELKRLKEREQETLTLHRNKIDTVNDKEGELFWTFSIKDNKTPYQSFKTVDRSTSIEVPASVRGAILGLSAYSPTNKGALCISFGSESGIGEALSHVFDRVGFVRFTRYNKKLDEDVSGADKTQKIIDLQIYVSAYVSVTLPSNILSLSINHNIELLSSIEKIWKVKMKSGKRELVITKKTSFIVIGPMEKEEEGVTMTHFLKRIQDNFENGCILCTMTPSRISGKKMTHRDFIKWLPPENFSEQQLDIKTIQDSIPWPPTPIVQEKRSKAVIGSSSQQETIDLESLVKEKSGEKQIEETEAETEKKTIKRNVQLKKLTCGSSTQIGQFEIATYVYTPPVEPAPVAAPTSREGEGAKDQGSGKQPKTTNEEQAKENEKLLVTAELH